MSEKEKQAYENLARWWMGRIITGQIKGGGIGLKELLDRASFRPDFVVPEGVVINHDSYSHFIRGKSGFEIEPPTLDTEEIVGVDNDSHLVIVPIEALIESHGQYFVLNNKGNRLPVTLQAALRGLEKNAIIKSGLKPGDKIIVSRKNPKAGLMIRVPLPFKEANEWDLFNYLVRLINQAKEEVWKNETQETARLNKLFNKIAEIFFKAMIIKDSVHK